jgi:hypothetical protein
MIGLVIDLSTIFSAGRLKWASNLPGDTLHARARRQYQTPCGSPGHAHGEDRRRPDEWPVRECRRHVAAIQRSLRLAGRVVPDPPMAINVEWGRPRVSSIPQTQRDRAQCFLKRDKVDVLHLLEAAPRIPRCLAGRRAAGRRGRIRPGRHRFRLRLERSLALQKRSFSRMQRAR